MFRPNTGVDLNEFPALGTPPTSSRGNPVASSSMLPTNGFPSYASTASSGQSVPLLGNARSDIHLSHKHSFPQSYNFDLEPSSQQHYPDSFTAAARDPWPMQPRTRQVNADARSQLAPGARKMDASPAHGLPPPPAPTNVPRASSTAQSDSTAGQPNGKLADPYGLLGLLSVIRMVDPDRSMLALGNDLTTLGLDLNTPDSIYSTFYSPWLDSQKCNATPAFYLPPCYRNVQATPEAHERMSEFSENVLFYAFYSMPNDKAQEAAAKALSERKWSYNVYTGCWSRKATNDSRNINDSNIYDVFDPTTWEIIKREGNPSAETTGFSRPSQPGASFL